jgi:very-short-patch-repair endonuclease
MNNIEKRFYDAFSLVVEEKIKEFFGKRGRDVQIPQYGSDINILLDDAGGVCCIESIDCQAPVGIYVVDFLIHSTIGLDFVVEIDGHESHKTKEQRFKDYRRERFLQEEGKTVFRFMASEVYVDALQCAQWVVDIINQKEQEWFNLVNDSFNRGKRAMQKAG